MVTVAVSYTLFALVEIGLEIENPWGDGPSDLDLDRYCRLLEMDLGGVVGCGGERRRWWGEHED